MKQKGIEDSLLDLKKEEIPKNKKITSQLMIDLPEEGKEVSFNQLLENLEKQNEPQRDDLIKLLKNGFNKNTVGQPFIKVQKIEEQEKQKEEQKEEQKEIRVLFEQEENDIKGRDMRTLVMDYIILSANENQVNLGENVFPEYVTSYSKCEQIQEKLKFIVTAQNIKKQELGQQIVEEIMDSWKSQQTEFYSVFLNSVNSKFHSEKPQHTFFRETNILRHNCYYVYKTFRPHFYQREKNFLILYRPTFFVLRTLLPITPLFEKIFEIFEQVVKKSLVKKLAEFNSKYQFKPLSVSLIDLQEIAPLNLYIEIFEEFYRQMEMMQLTDNFRNCLPFQFDSIHFLYTLPRKFHSSFLICKTACSEFIFSLPLEDLLFLISSIFYERTLVFISESPTKLSAAITTLLTIIYPFHWTYPQLVLVPEECHQLLSSAVPVILGVACSSQKFLTQIMPNNADPSKGDTTYIFLDDHFYYYNPDTLGILKLPSHNQLVDVLKNHYSHHFSKKKSSHFKINEEKWNKQSFYEFKSVNLTSLKTKILSAKKGSIKSLSKVESFNSLPITKPPQSADELFLFFKHYWISFQKLYFNFDQHQRELLEQFKYGELIQDINFQNENDKNFCSDFIKTQMLNFYIQNTPYQFINYL